MRRVGYPLFGGGWGGGGIGGGGLLGDLMAGGLGYMVGRQQGATNQQQYPPQYQQQPYPQQPYPQQPYPQQQYQQPAQGNMQNSQLAQLQLLGQLHDAGTLTDQEFQAQKQKILNGF